jgi:hypothetical protein
MAVMGGIAVAAWQQVRATQDVDLLIELGDIDTTAVVRRLADASIRAKRTPPILTIGDLRILQCLYEPPGSFVEIQIDLLFADSEFHRSVLQRKSPARLPGVEHDVAVVACEDLILFKLLAGRVLDRVDAAALLRANRHEMEWRYLKHWTEKLALASALAEIWDEAFPGEKPPD